MAAWSGKAGGNYTRMTAREFLGTLKRLRGLTQREGAWIIGFAAVGWVVVFGRLGYPSLFDPDEAHYAQLTREMIRAHSWFVPLLDGSPYIDKPVLFHWLQIACVSLFGESEFAMRLPTASAGIILILVTRWLGAQMFGVGTGNVAALMFATMPFTFALANVALFDMVYTAFLFGAVACVDRGGGPATNAAAVPRIRVADPGGHDQGTGGAGPGNGVGGGDGRDQPRDEAGRARSAMADRAPA